MRTEQVETITGKGRVQLGDRYAKATGLDPVNLVIRVFQDFADDNTPTLKHASGSMDLPLGDVARAMMDQDPIEVDLEGGRKATILFTEIGGAFTVTGPIAQDCRR